MAKYIKSYSNYVVKKQHQLTNDGIIYERDITTIGGLNQFAKGQKPIYQSGNFIITVRDEQNGEKNYTNNKWFKNNDSEIWTLANLSAMTESTDETMDIIIKQDYYKLKDFAYYGSCSELIRGSMTDIIDRFPGELYSSTKFNSINVTLENGKSTAIGSGSLVDNPFNINIHAIKVTNTEAAANPLKYFCNDGYKHYEIFQGDSNKAQEVTAWTSNCKTECALIGDNIGTVTINGISIKVYKISEDGVAYFTNNSDIHIRPKKKFYVDFFKSLDAFQRVILNRDSKPKYSTLFEVTMENEYGYYTELKRFSFPIAEGGYNLAVNTFGYASYLQSLIDVADFYDKTFCDNLYRMMTHEAIKNFDWTYTREYATNEADPYILGGTRIQKALRLFGREFDEIKYYIDSISYANNLTYSDSCSMPDYFLTDSVENDGWNVVNIYPFKKNTENMSFSDDIELKITPYANNENICYPNGYFMECGNPQPVEVNDKQIKKSTKGALLTRIKQYISDKEYTMNQVNNHFLKMLRLNSRNIFRHKGTIEGIEMILSLFGLKSKRWVESMKDNDDISNRTRLFDTECGILREQGFDSYDFDIKEYVTYTSGLTDTVDDNKGFYNLDWYNYTKTIAYNTDNYRNGLYQSYQGLPIRYYYNENEELTDDKPYPTRYLFPYFDKNAIIDGNPYYQMNGGWIWKTKQFNTKDEVVESAYTETLKNEMAVEDIMALVGIPATKLSNNVIYKVNDMSKDYISINGVIYPLLKEYDFNVEKPNDIQQSYEYFVVECGHNQINIGNNVYLDTIYVSDPHGDSENKKLHDLSEYNYGRPIKIYVIDNNILCQESFLMDTITPSHDILFIRNGLVEGQSENLTLENKTNYFLLQDVNHKYQIGGMGWKQLSVEDEEYKGLQNIENYFNGNNPHSGNNSYDDGKEYLNYFIQLFKYAVENKYFDKRCYDRIGLSFDDELKKLQKDEDSMFGFKDILIEKEGEDETKIVNEIEDVKIEYFGDYCTQDGDGDAMKTITYTYEMFPQPQDEATIDEEDNDKPTPYNLSNMEKWSGMTFIDDSIGCTEQIVNIKRVDIIFNIDADSADNDAYIKYMDDVVLNYVSQMIPSNTILHIIYETKETES